LGKEIVMKKIFIAALPAVLLGGMLAKGVTAQTSTTSQPSTEFIGWDANAHEVAVTAIIQQAVPNHSSGIPVGLHLMLGTPQGVVDASVGPYLSAEIQQALIAGKTVQVTGQVKTIHNQNFLIVRQLVLDGRSVRVRNDHGSLVHIRSKERTHSQTLSGDQNGGTK
jgi:hypothetical protein